MPVFTLNIHKQLSHFQLNVSFTVDNEITVLFGRSGSGKTTILHSIAGLIHPDGGKIQLNDTVFFEEGKKNLPPQKRKIGYLFQDYALFPHMTVEKNIRYGMKSKSSAILSELMQVLGISHLMQKYPHQISGGEKQRVALARALATEPQMLLLDEPLSALDHATRRQCQDEILRIHAMWNIPFLIVSHDREEAKKLGRTILYIEQGTIVGREDNR
jgi:molybdate transport system ATP-binding protein